MDISVSPKLADEECVADHIIDMFDETDEPDESHYITELCNEYEIAFNYLFYFHYIKQMKQLVKSRRTLTIGDEKFKSQKEAKAT